jgi:hypothetical protein
LRFLAIPAASCLREIEGKILPTNKQFGMVFLKELLGMTTYQRVGIPGESEKILGDFSRG